MKRISFLLILALFTLACQEENDTYNTDAQFGQDEGRWTLPDGELADMNPLGDSYDLDAASYEADILTIETSYVGGCKEHIFELRWPDQFLANGEAIPVLLVHDNQGDLCEAANIPQRFTADLSAVGLINNLEAYELIIVNASNPSEQLQISVE
jgi:hypothetical protein